MISSMPPLTVLCAAALFALGGCDKPQEPPEPPDEAGSEAGSEAVAVTDANTDAADTVATPALDADPVPAAALPADTLGDDATLDALVDESEIPYPVYPNGEKYRVGGENGLKIVLFETSDSFEEVDAYYDDRVGESGMPRLAAMDDYVRYARAENDDDPWATHRPGIVIHRFDGDEERDAVGADASARTNIIMSF